MSKRKFSRREVGYPNNTRTTKVHRNLANSINTISSSGNTASRFLNIYDLTKIPKTTDNDVNYRQRNVINLIGWKIYFQIQNKTIFPMYLNWAICAARNDNVDYTDPANKATLEAGFFSAPYNPDKNVPFDFALNSMQLYKYPINPDNLVVLKHKRYEIGGQYSGAATVDVNYKNNTRTMSKFYRLKRQLRYTGDGGETCMNRVFLMWWYDLAGTPQTDSGEANAAHITQEVHAYFREP